MKESVYINMERREQLRQLWEQEKEATHTSTPRALHSIKLPEEEEVLQLPRRIWPRKKVWEMVREDY